MTAMLPPPDYDAALATGGVLCHFVASDPAMTEAFRAWVEHHPGDLDAAMVVQYLGEVHDILAPSCQAPATKDLNPWRRIRAVPETDAIADARATREHMRRWADHDDHHHGE